MDCPALAGLSFTGDNMNLHERKIAEAMGHDRSKPMVQFFDHAAFNATLTKESGRPRYTSHIYLRKIPSAPDLVVRDVFDRAMVEEDKTDWPEEWALYEKRTGGMNNMKPPITAIPGIDVASKAELAALELFTCDDFVNYAKPLEGLEELRETARAIMEVSDAIRKKRESVRTEEGRQIHRDSGISVPRGGLLSADFARPKKEVFQKAGKEESNQTFHYEITI